MILFAMFAISAAALPAEENKFGTVDAWTIYKRGQACYMLSTDDSAGPRRDFAVSESLSTRQFVVTFRDASWNMSEIKASYAESVFTVATVQGSRARQLIRLNGPGLEQRTGSTVLLSSGAGAIVLTLDADDTLNLRNALPRGDSLELTQWRGDVRTPLADPALRNSGAGLKLLDQCVSWFS